MQPVKVVINQKIYHNADKVILGEMLAKQTEKELESPKFIKSLAILSCLSFFCLQFALSFLFTFALIVILSGRLFLKSARKLKNCGMIFFLPKIILVRLFDKTIFDTLYDVQQIPKVALDCMRSILSLQTQQEEVKRSSELTKNEKSMEKKKMIIMNVLETKGILNLLPQSVSMAILPRNYQNVDNNKNQSDDDDKESLASISTDTSKKQSIDLMDGQLDKNEDISSISRASQKIGENNNGSSFDSNNFKKTNILVNSQNKEERKEKTETNQSHTCTSPQEIYNKNSPQNNDKTEDNQRCQLEISNTQEIGKTNIATSTYSHVGLKQEQSKTISKWNTIHQFRNKLKSNCIKMGHSSSVHGNHHQKHHPKSGQQSQSQSFARKSNPLASIFMTFRNLNAIKKFRNLTHIDNKTLIKAFLVSSLFVGSFLSTTRSLPLDGNGDLKKKSTSGMKNKAK